MPGIYDLDKYKNPHLTNFAQGYRPVEFHNRKFIPAINVLQDVGQYQIRGGRVFLTDTTRALRSKAKTIEAPIDNFETYACVEHALATVLDKRQEIDYAKRISATKVLDLKENAVKTVAYAMEISREKQVADILFNPAKYASNNKLACSSAQKWTAETGDIVSQVKTARKQMYESCGIEPNTIVMGKNAFDLAIGNAKIKSLFQYVAINVDLTVDQLKTALNVKNIYVVDCMYQNNKGVLTKVWDTNTAVLIYAPTPEELALGYPVHTAAFDLINSIAVREYDEQEVVRIARYENYDIKHISDKNGYLISGVA